MLIGMTTSHVGYDKCLSTKEKENKFNHYPFVYMLSIHLTKIYEFFLKSASTRGYPHIRKYLKKVYIL